MAITKAIIFTPIENAEVLFGRTVSEETIRKFIENSNMLAELAKIGSIVAINTAIPGVPSPNAQILQPANGSEILNGDSPLRSDLITQRYTPNLDGKFLRGAPDTVSNPTGGSTTVDLQHEHTVGIAGEGPIVGEEGNDVPSGMPNHTHDMSPDLGVQNLDPYHIRIAHYLKIN